MPSASPRVDPAPLAAHGARYLVGGLLCALVNNAVLIGADALGLPLLAVVAVSWAAGGTTGYLWHACVTYRAPLSLAAFARFLAGVAAAIPLSWAALAVLTGPLGLAMVIAAPVATVILFAYNYLNARLAITRRLSLRSR